MADTINVEPTAEGYRRIKQVLTEQLLTHVPMKHKSHVKTLLVGIIEAEIGARYKTAQESRVDARVADMDLKQGQRLVDFVRELLKQTDTPNRGAIEATGWFLAWFEADAMIDMSHREHARAIQQGTMLGPIDDLETIEVSVRQWADNGEKLTDDEFEALKLAATNFFLASVPPDKDEAL